MLARRVALVLLIGLWACAGRAAADLQVACAPERGVAAPGEALALHAWVTDDAGRVLREPVKRLWGASAGTLAPGEPAMWQLPATPGRATARIAVDAGARGRGTCELSVEVMPPPAAPAATSLRSLLAARALLVRGATEPAGFGLYSYLLFDAAAADEVQRQRQLRAIESYLREIHSLEALADLRPPSQLNLTLLPVRNAVPLPAQWRNAAELAAAAQAVLAEYDHARAQHLLDALGERAPRGGVVLASRRAPASQPGLPTQVMDLSVVSPRLAADWVRAFCWLSAQERSWTEASLLKLGLGTRNAVAVAASVLGEAVLEWPRLLRSVAPR